MKMRATLFLAAVAGATLASAQGFPYGTAPHNGPYGPPIRWSTYERGLDCAITTPGVYTLASFADYNQYQRLFHGSAFGTGFINTAAPINFNTHMMIAIHMGRVAGSGYSIWVNDIQRTSSHYWGVYVANQVPIRSSSTLAASFASPYVIIVVERTVGIPQYFYSTYGVRTHTIHNHGCGCHGGGGVYRWQNGSLVRIG